MDAQLKAKWVEALRSGKFKQTRHRLKDHKGYCCIGVGHKVKTGETPKANWRSHPIAVGLGLTDEQFIELVDKNDFHQNNFAEIADYIEANL